MKHFAVMLPGLSSIYIQMLFFFFTVKFLWSQPCRAASALGNETDHLALLKFKESISNDPFKILASWNSSSHFCNWHGVTCSRRHQRVTELNLQGYSLHGFISPYVGNLSFVRSLNLMNNSFNDKIPQELGRLFRLRQLMLANNTLAGDFPSNLTTCSELRELCMSRNILTGTIPIQIGSFMKLESFDISENNLTGQIPTSVGNLSSLIYLSVAKNSLEGNIPEEISHLKNLTSLNLGGNNLSGMIPSSFFYMSSLTVMVLQFNQFYGSLPANMFLTLPKLEKFLIDENQFSGPIPTSITNASLLQVLHISINHFVGEVPTLGKSKDLSWLCLGGNRLGSNSTKDLKFLSSLTNCSKLEKLFISNNNFGGPLPSSIGNLSTQLSRLHLAENQISGKIPVALGNLINLTVLVMEYNQLTGIIPDTLGKLQKLQHLSLSGNKLTGDIPDFIGNFSNLFFLDLSQNMLEGNIPPNIGNCQILQYLDLSKNNFKGAIPVAILSLSSLTVLLNLSHNSLSGTLPSDVGSLRNVDKLDVSENHLSGAIPGKVSDCQSLEYLYLQGNSFHEFIPSSLALMKGLRYLDLSRNNLFGSIPKGLQDNSGLEYLNLSFNKLDGEIPTKGVFRNASRIVVIGNSNLCGGIKELQLPSCPVKDLKQRKHHSFRLVAVTICVVAFLFLLSFILAIYRIKKRDKKSSSNLSTIELLSSVSYRNLHHATDGFSASNMVGSGGFGSVYKGSLESEDRVVAIKVLNLQKKGARKSFLAECNALKNIRHRNLVKILTCCSSTNYSGHEFKALVFEYMKNGSLEKWLHPVIDGAKEPTTLNLDQRLNIIVDIASALHYLHYGCEQPIIHCDLKPSNVLLDDDMIAHVSDFGLARLLSTINGTSDKQTSTIGMKGTIGYAPPEYGLGSEVSTQGDIYSFGILLLELLTGRRPLDAMFKDDKNLHNFVKIAFPGNILQVVDPTLLPRYSEVAKEKENKVNLIVHPKVEKCLISLFRIALACSVESPKERMNMEDVTRELNLNRNSFMLMGSAEIDLLVQRNYQEKE